MLDNINIENILFLDIETVPQYPQYSSLSVNLKKLWDIKAAHIASKDEDTPETLYERAGIYAEFGKIICISVGYVKNFKLKIKSFADHDEKKLLLEFSQLLTKYYNTPNHQICGHNIKEFDLPYISRRLLINNIRLPSMLDNSSKKPWEVNHLDTMQMWRFGDYKSFTSLDLLTNILNIPSPKNDIDGKDVARVYWKEDNLKRIVTYCQQDVIAVVRLLNIFQSRPYIKDENIILSD